VTIRPGDVAVVEFPGAEVTKRRPAVVLSTPAYHASRPDVVLGLLTSQVDAALAPTDYALEDWASAGLRRPSAFRAFLVTLPAGSVAVVGHLSDRDWEEVRRRVRLALAVT
jgi:mRNA interferase MazF